MNYQQIHPIAKGLVAELTLPHIQSAWGFRGERVRAAGLAACYNYFSKEKKGYTIPQNYQ